MLVSFQSFSEVRLPSALDEQRRQPVEHWQIQKPFRRICCLRTTIWEANSVKARCITRLVKVLSAPFSIHHFLS